MTIKNKNTVITDVYACISVRCADVRELARALNEENARAFRLGKKMWKPVGNPIVRDFAQVDLLVVREDKLDINQ